MSTIVSVKGWFSVGQSFWQCSLSLHRALVPLISPTTQSIGSPLATLHRPSTSAPSFPLPCTTTEHFLPPTDYQFQHFSFRLTTSSRQLFLAFFFFYLLTFDLFPSPDHQHCPFFFTWLQMAENVSLPSSTWFFFPLHSDFCSCGGPYHLADSLWNHFSFRPHLFGTRNRQLCELTSIAGTEARKIWNHFTHAIFFF